MGGGGCILSRCAPRLFKGGCPWLRSGEQIGGGDASEEAVAGAQARVTGPRRIGSNGRSEGKVICDKSV